MRRNENELALPTSTASENAFPTAGRTLFLTAHGNVAVLHAQQFIRELGDAKGRNGKSASGELFRVAAVSGVDEHTRDQVKGVLYNATATTSERLVPYIWKGEVILGSPEETGRAFKAEAERQSDTARVGLHFVSYDGKNAEEIRRNLVYYQQDLTSLFHMAFIISPREDDGMGLFWHKKGIEQYPPEEFGIPVVVVDSTKDPHRDRDLKATDIVRKSLAIIVGAHHTIPYNYLDLLKTLADQSRFIGVSVGSHRASFPYAPTREHFEMYIADDTEGALAETFSTKSNLSPYDKIGDALTVSIAGVPISPRHWVWGKPEVLARMNPQDTFKTHEEVIPIPTNRVTLIAPLAMKGSKDKLKVIAVNFFPGRNTTLNQQPRIEYEPKEYL